ncbi:MAG: hypothetical protein SV765_14065 [Pseudomonadota bacterium]|nr:hypothetical protein [Pseudomonadota bacterium]
MTKWVERLLQRRMNRVHYVGLAVVALYLLPLLLGAVFRRLGLPVYQGFGSGSSSMISLMAFWYLQIPLFAWGTLLRVQDIGWPRWVAAILWFPFINLLLWFWPGESQANQWGEPPAPAGIAARILAFGAPLWILLAYGLALWVLVQS